MPRKIATTLLVDFSGGLNLKADAFQLAPSEIMDVQNLDLDIRGGFFQRDSMSCFNTGLTPNVPQNVWAYTSAAGQSYAVVQQGSDIAYSTTGGTFTRLRPDALTTTGVMNSAEMKDLMFVQRNAERVPFRWDGTTLTVLASAFNDNLAAPTGGNMPTAKVLCAWGGYMWTANTVETAVAWKSRLRFSHPNQPGDWRTNDYIDVDIGRDGDEITALMPLGDRLFVFKNRSTYVVSGYDANTFSVYEVSRTVGTINQRTVTTSEYGIYSYSWPDGVFLISSERDHPRWSFERLSPVVSTLTASAQTSITLGWLNRRLWVSLPVSPSSTNTAVYVLDPALAKPRSGSEGGWTKYALALGPMLELRRSGLATLQLACSATRGRVHLLHGTASTDEYCTDEMVLTGASGTYSWTADTAALSITGDIDLRAWVKATDWTPTSIQTLVGKWETTGNQRSYNLSLDTTGKLILEWSANGTAVISKISTVVSGITDATWKFVRATLDVDNGAAGSDVRFYTSDDGLTWTQLGATVTTAGVTSIYNSTARATVGALLDAGTSQRFIGSVRSATVIQGLTGTPIQGAPDYTSIVYSATSVTDANAQVWALAGAASLTKNDPEIYTWLTTRWVDDGLPQVIKRWRRPEIVLEGGVARNIRVDVWRNYDTSQIKRTLYTTTDAATGQLVWSVGNWDAATSLWGADAAAVQEINRIGALGKARSVRLKFTKQNTGSDWGISALVFKYIPRRVRG